MRAIGFCHLLLQSRAPVSRSFSTRALPHACGQLRFPHSLFVRRRTSEHPAVSRRQSDCGGCRWRSPSIIGPLSCLSRLSDVPACGSLRIGPHTEAAPRALCDAVREDLAVLRSGTTSIERYISRPTSCDACRTPPGVDPMSRACPAFVGFAANAPSSTPLHRDDPALLSQTRLPRLGPRSHPLV